MANDGTLIICIAKSSLIFVSRNVRECPGKNWEYAESQDIIHKRVGTASLSSKRFYLKPLENIYTKNLEILIVLRFRRIFLL